MKKLVPFILIAIIFGQMLLPFSIGSGVKNNPIVRINKAEAVNYNWTVTSTMPDGTQLVQIDPTNNFTSMEECKIARDIVAARVTTAVVGDCEVWTKPTPTVAGMNENKPKETPDSNLTCKIIPFRIGACIAQGLYWLFFKTTSALFSLAGKAMDFTLKYTLMDTSYRSSFVVEGWGVIRDFCNMFFIFVLLYIAIGTILNLNSVKTKEMIVNVIIIGLLINFSLFATQIIIDASNILARVFYNPETIVITQKDATGNDIAATNGGVGQLGELRLSEAIVSKVDPQNLIANSSKVSEIPTKDVAGIDDNTVTTGKGITVGSFILIIFLSTAVNVFGMIAFLSCTIIFITRVVGLWMAMILAPLAFFSYTIPQMQDIEMIGWKKWWPNTLKLAFLAPVFVFFMYLIVGFLDKFDIAGASTLTGMNFVMAIVVPFIFVMVLLMKAKSIAHDMSGEIGQAVTKGIAAFGGLALGGAALGVAALGRSTIGAVSRHVQNDDARGKDKDLKQKTKDAWKGVGLNPFKAMGAIGKTIKATGKAASAWTAEGIHSIPSTKKDAAGNRLKVGEVMKEAEKGFGKKATSQNTLDSKTDKEFADKGKYKKGVTFKDLTEDEQLEVRMSIDKDQLAKQMGFGSNFDAIKEDVNKVAVTNAINAGYNNYKVADKSDAAKLAAAEANLKTDTGIISKDTSGEMIQYAKAPAALGEFVSALRKGSYDVRNISKLESSSKGFPKLGIGLAAVVASGVRMGFKSGPGVEYGTGQRNVMKDIGSVVTEALKGIKVDVKADSGGGHSTPSSGGGHH
jgi:hypothetical protein